MIVDVLENSAAYEGMHPKFKAAFAFLRRPDLAKLAPGRHDVDDDLYVMVEKGPSRKREDGRIETHDEWIDIQFVIEGTDAMGWKPRSMLLSPVERKDPRADVRFYDDDPSAWLMATPGTFAVFFPDDAHLPNIGDGLLHRAIAKVRA